MTNLKITKLDGEEEEEPIVQLIECELLKSLAQTNTQSKNTHITLIVRDAGSEIVGGLTASTSYGWLLIKTLWIDEALRGTGLGRQLMQRAESEGLVCNCHSAWLDTSSATAREFYERLGYSPFGVLRNGTDRAPAGHTRWFLSKVLIDSEVQGATTL